MSVPRATTAFLALLIAGVATAGTLAYATSSGESPKADYAVLRQAAKPIDQLTKDGRELARRMPKSFHIHAKDSRSTRLKTGHGVWLIPGRTRSASSPSSRATACEAPATTWEPRSPERSTSPTSGNGKRKSFKEVTGALPDDGAKVRLVGAGGAEKKLELRNNTYSRT